MKSEIFCSRCKNKIGEHIRFCPRCGHENNTQNKIKKSKKHLIIIPLVVLIILAGVYIIKNKETNPESTKPQVEDTLSLLPFDENGKWGYMNKSGKVVINPQYDWADVFSEGLAGIMIDDKYGYINENGEMIINAEYDEVGNVDIGLGSESEFKNGLVSAKKDNKYYMLDKDGNIVTKDYVDPSLSSTGLPVESYGDVSGFSSYAHDKYYSLSEGMSIYKDNDTEKYGYVNEEGNVVIEAQFDYACEFSEGLAAVEKDGLLGYINNKGDVVIDYQFEIGGHKEEDSKLSEGLIAVKKDGKYGYVDRKGKFIIENKYAYAGKFVDGLAYVVLNEDEISKYDIDFNNEFIVGLTEANYIDKKGDIVIENIDLPIYFDQTIESYFSNNLLPVYKDAKVGYINKNGENQSDYIFDWATTFRGDVSRVVVGDDSFWINDEFNVIVPYQGTMSIEEYFDYREDKNNKENYNK